MNKFFCFLISLCLTGGSSGSAASAIQQGTAAPAPQSITLLEAVQSTLNNHPQLKIQQAQVELNRGIREQNSGLFDSLVLSRFTQLHNDIPLTRADQLLAQQAGLALNHDVTDLSGYVFQVDKLFRNGIEITPVFQLNRDVDILAPHTGVNTSALSLVINIPLLRGRGRKAVAAREEAAAREVEASLFDLDQVMAQLIANTASSYWSLVAAQKQVAVAMEAETRGRTYLDNVKALVDADQVPRNDMNEATANLASRSATRIAAEQQLATARQQMAFNMGAAAAKMLTGVDATEDFPATGQTPPADTLTSLEYFLQEGLQNRGDYLASERRQVEARTLVTAAKNALLPQLNLTLSGGYAGLQEGRSVGNLLASSVGSIPGPTASGGINYTFPTGNHAASGQLIQAKASAIQAEQLSQNLARTISSEISVAVEGVRNSILQVKEADQAVLSSRAALEGEQEKYRTGFGSIVDVLTTEDRLTTALNSQIQAQLDYALALVQFRLATGTLVEPGRPQLTLPPTIFSTLPFIAAPGERP
jgi:outer membrane protein TolC